MICPSQIIGKASDKHNLMVPDTDTYVRFSLLKIIYFINHTFPSPFHTLQGSLVYTDEPSHAFI